MKSVKMLLAGESETDRLGKIIGTHARAGDILYMDGELGAGKTTLTKSVAGALGVPRTHVTSPTFTLVHEYREGRLPVYHFDLYRLKNSRDLDQLGFDDYLSSGDGVIIIEWANNVAERLIDEGLSIRIIQHASNANFRDVLLSASGTRSNLLLETVAKEFAC